MNEYRTGARMVDPARQYGGMQATDVHRIKEMADKISKLERIVATQANHEAVRHVRLFKSTKYYKPTRARTDADVREAIDQITY